MQSSDVSPGQLRVDLHTHTRHSADAVIPPSELVERAFEKGLDRIAVTDHGSIQGALEARELAPDRVIVGEEIRSRCRTDLIGLFLSERIPDGLRLEEVVERIQGQGGIVYAPHPYAYPWRARWRAERALAVADIVEVFNARAFLPTWNRAARRGARDRGLSIGAGSDAHFPAEVGRAYTEMPGFVDADSFRRAVERARAVGVETTSPLYHMASSGLKALRLTGEFRRRLSRGLTAPRTAPIER